MHGRRAHRREPAVGVVAAVSALVVFIVVLAFMVGSLLLGLLIGRLLRGPEGDVVDLDARRNLDALARAVERHPSSRARARREAQGRGDVS